MSTQAIPYNNPATCEVLIDGQRCGQMSSYVFRSAFAIRLVCDSCARRYRTEGSTAPLFEYVLLELIPAREVLLTQLQVTSDRLDKTRRTMEIEQEARRLVWLLVIGGWVATLVSFTVLSLLGDGSRAPWAALGTMLLWWWVAPKMVDRQWTEPRKKALDLKYPRIGK